MAKGKYEVRLVVEAESPFSVPAAIKNSDVLSLIVALLPLNPEAVVALAAGAKLLEEV